MKISKQRLIIRTIAAIAITNFMGFCIVAEVNGGSAGNGYEQAGHFFLGNHGKFTETTTLFYQYSIWHERIMWLTMGAFAGAVMWGASLGDRTEA